MGILHDTTRLLAVIAIALAASALIVGVVAIAVDSDDDASASPAPPTKEDDPAGYTQRFVQEAVDLYDADGRAALLARYNDASSADGDWYVYVIDLEGTLIAHPTIPELVGQSVHDAIGVDVSGRRFGPEFLDITEDGGWITYYFKNPNGAECEFKHSWAVRRGDVIIGSGWYESALAHPLLPSKCEPADYTVASVARAIARYRAEGREAVIAHHSKPDSVDGRWYVFILDAQTGRALAHPAPEFVGYDLLDGAEGYDDAGYAFAVDLMQATEEGIVVGNVISSPGVDELNPFHTFEEVKHYYARLDDGLIFVSGWYAPAPTKDDPSEYARLLVARALTMYDDRGAEAAVAHHNAPENADGAWYVFFIEERGGQMVTAANANRPDLVGSTGERIDANGFNFGEAFAAITEEGGGEWVDYLFTHPVTRQDALKHSWAVRRGNHVIGVGWYEGIE